MNAALGNLGKTVELRGGPSTAGAGTLTELAEAIGKGQVETLVILGGNPAYDAPADLDFAALLKRVKTTIRLGLHADETSRAATWHLPAAHYLESWGCADRGRDDRADPAADRAPRRRADGAGGDRPAVGLRDGRPDGDRPPGLPEGERRRRGGRRGRLAALPPRRPACRLGASGRETGLAAGCDRDGGRGGLAFLGPLSADRLELILDVDAKVDDGRFANNGWLQELPEPVTKLTWDNAATLSPETARALGVSSGDVVRLELPGRTLEIAAQVIPGQADFSIAVPLGYGRAAAGRVGRGVGVNAYVLRTTTAPDIAVGLKVTRTGRTHTLACTQDHFTMEGRDLVREQPLADVRGRTAPVPRSRKPPRSSPGRCSKANISGGW